MPPASAPASIPVLDYQRSYLRFRMDLTKTSLKTVSQPPPFTLNNSRFLLEGRCRLTRPASLGGASAEFVLSASCKAEQVNVPENIWHDPPADMCLIASQDEFLIIKSWDRNNRGVMLSPPSLGPQPERQVGRVKDAFTALQIDLREIPGRVLATTEQIVAAVLNNRSLISRTEYRLPDGTAVVLEYPVKVINASEREVFYQIDTGPALVPDPDSYDGQHLVSMLRKAFIAHNNLGCTELLVDVPTPIAPGISVNHYSRVVPVSATNWMLEVD